MNKTSAFTRRAWEKYPIYFTDEDHDNLDDDPNDPRNTSKTLAEELAVCAAKELASEATTSSGIALNPEKRVKARIGKTFLRRANAAKATGSYMQEKTEAHSGIQNGTSNGGLQDASGLGRGMQVGKFISPSALDFGTAPVGGLRSQATTADK